MIKDRGRQAGESLGWLKPRWCTAALTNYHEQERTSRSKSNASSETLHDLLPISLPTSLLPYSSRNVCGIARSIKTRNNSSVKCYILRVSSSGLLNFLTLLVKKNWEAILGVFFIYLCLSICDYFMLNDDVIRHDHHGRNSSSWASASCRTVRHSCNSSASLLQFLPSAFLMSLRATSILLTLGLPSLFSSELLIWLLKNNFETMWFSEALLCSKKKTSDFAQMCNRLCF